MELTTNHWGWFELKLCPVNDKLGQEKQNCMDKYPLRLINDPSSSKFYIPEDSKKKDIFKYKVQLPPDVVCSQCVLQWTYRTGNFSFHPSFRLYSRNLLSNFADCVIGKILFVQLFLTFLNFF